MRNSEKTYWCANGKFQKEIEEIGKFIPTMGKSKNPLIEIARVVQNWYYDVYNNGGCNLIRLKELKEVNKKFGIIGNKIVMEGRDWRRFAAKRSSVGVYDHPYMDVLESETDRIIETVYKMLKEEKLDQDQKAQ